MDQRGEQYRSQTDRGPRVRDTLWSGVPAEPLAARRRPLLGRPFPAGLWPSRALGHAFPPTLPRAARPAHCVVRTVREALSSSRSREVLRLTHAGLAAAATPRLDRKEVPRPEGRLVLSFSGREGGPADWDPRKGLGPEKAEARVVKHHLALRPALMLRVLRRGRPHL